MCQRTLTACLHFSLPFFFLFSNERKRRDNYPGPGSTDMRSWASFKHVGDASWPRLIVVSLLPLLDIKVKKKGRRESAHLLVEISFVLWRFQLKMGPIRRGWKKSWWKLTHHEGPSRPIHDLPLGWDVVLHDPWVNFLSAMFFPSSLMMSLHCLDPAASSPVNVLICELADPDSRLIMRNNHAWRIGTTYLWPGL